MDMNPQGNDPIKYVGMPPALNPSITDTKHWFQALDNFCRFMAIRQGDRVLMLTDPLLDPRVIDAFTGLAASRGATLSVYMAPNTQLPGIPEELKPLIQQASFIVSTWFCSIEDPFNVAMRKAGQRWVKNHLFSRPRPTQNTAGALSGRTRQRDHPRNGAPHPQGLRL